MEAVTEGSVTEKRLALEARMADYASADVCLAFSGGVDSSLLLKTAADAARTTGRKVYAVTFDTKLHPSCDLENAKRVAKELGGIHEVITVDELSQEGIKCNPENRCYLCKKQLFTQLRQYAGEHHTDLIIDGTNEDDLHVYRPGIQALKELGIKSPLADLHITKSQVKLLAGYYGISAASRPSTPCMATRLPYGTELDYEILRRIEEGEACLKALLAGNVRLRLHGDIARLEVDEQSFISVMEKREEVVKRLKDLGFCYITLDLEGFRSGSMDIHVNKKI